MKKLTILFMITFLLSGCGANNQGIVDEYSAAPVASNDSTLLQKINNIMSGRKSIDLEAAKKAAKEDEAQKVEPAPNEEVVLENLAGEFSQAVLRTNYGDITLAFYADQSPVTVNNFLNLAKKGFYDGTKFHRVIPDFMIQGGDPNSKDDDWSNDGTGGPGYAFKDEFNSQPLARGSLAMANSGPDTNGSQFFVVTAESTPWLDGKHTNFGYVVSGMDIIDAIEEVETNERDHPIDDVIIENIELLTEAPSRAADAAAVAEEINDQENTTEELNTSEDTAAEDENSNEGE